MTAFGGWFGILSDVEVPRRRRVGTSFGYEACSYEQIRVHTGEKATKCRVSSGNRHFPRGGPAETFARLRLVTRSVTLSQPGETPLHHPPPRLDREALRLRVAPDDLQLPAAVPLAPSRQLLACIRAIRPDLLQVRDEWGQSGEQSPAADRVMRVRRRDRDRDRQPQRIDEEMALTPFDALVAVVTADRGRFLDRLDALRVHDRRRGPGGIPCPRAPAPPGGGRRGYHSTVRRDGNGGNSNRRLARAGSHRGDSARDSRCGAERRWRRRPCATSGDAGAGPWRAATGGERIGYLPAARIAGDGNWT